MLWRVRGLLVTAAVALLLVSELFYDRARTAHQLLCAFVAYHSVVPHANTSEAADDACRPLFLISGAIHAASR